LKDSAKAMQFTRLQLNYLNFNIKDWSSQHYTHIFVCFALFALFFIDWLINWFLTPLIFKLFYTCYKCHIISLNLDLQLMYGR